MKRTPLKPSSRAKCVDERTGCTWPARALCDDDVCDAIEVSLRAHFVAVGGIVLGAWIADVAASPPTSTE